MLPFIPYIRISRIGGRRDEKRISDAEQMRTAAEVAKAHGVELWPEAFKDLDASGANLDRPEFERALALVREGKAGGIIVKTLDRFSRDVVDGANAIREIESHGATTALLCGDGEVSFRDPDKAFVSFIKLAQGEADHGRRTGYIADTVRNAIDRGVHLQEAFGYQRSNGRGSPLEVVDAEARVVRVAFQMRADGHSWAQVAEAMNATGVLPRPRRHKREGDLVQSRWTWKTARGLVVGREVYLGVAYSGEHRTEDAHPAIVTRDLYDRANGVRGTRFVERDEQPEYLLSGLVRCASCGYVMTHQRQAGRNGGGRYYRCRQAQGSTGGRCEAPASANADELEAWVADEFDRAAFGIGAVAYEGDAVGEAVAALEDWTRKLEHALARNADLDLDPDEAALAERHVDEIRAQRKAAKRRLEDAQRGDRLRDLPRDLDAEGVEAAPIADRRHWLALAFDAVVVRPSRRWRESVSERAQVLDGDEAPSDRQGLIAFVAALDLG